MVFPQPDVVAKWSKLPVAFHRYCHRFFFWVLQLGLQNCQTITVTWCYNKWPLTKNALKSKMWTFVLKSMNDVAIYANFWCSRPILHKLQYVAHRSTLNTGIICSKDNFFRITKFSVNVIVLHGFRNNFNSVVSHISGLASLELAYTHTNLIHNNCTKFDSTSKLEVK